MNSIFPSPKLIFTEKFVNLLISQIYVTFIVDLDVDLGKVSI